MEIEAYLKKDYIANLVREGKREDGRAMDTPKTRLRDPAWSSWARQR